MSRLVCSIEGCERPHYAKSYCNAHWRRWKRNGDPGPAEIATPNPGPCSFDGCERLKSCKGLCATHYAQQRRGRPLTPILERDPEAVSWRRLDRTLQSLYGIGADEYHRILAQQGGVCAVCGVSENGSGRRLAVDHDHDSGEVRGILCENCNFGIGSLRDDPEVLRRAIDYIDSDGL